MYRTTLKSHLIAVLVLLAATPPAHPADSAPGSGRAHEALPAWAPDTLKPDPDGWELSGVWADETMVFYVSRREATRTGNIVAIWTRAEFRDPQQAADFAFLSSRTRLEFDCTARRYRLVAATGFAGHGLSGQAYPSPQESDPPWQVVSDGKASAEMRTWACGNIRAGS